MIAGRRVVNMSQARIHTRIRGKGRPRFDSRTRVTYTDGLTRIAEDDVRCQYAAQTRTRPEWEGPVAVNIMTHRPICKSRPKCVGEPDTAKPDIDNIVKLVLDALNGVAWADDSQIIYLIVEKASRGDVGSDEYIDIQVAYLGEMISPR